MGVNDAPAFAAADVGIAVAGAHPAAMRTAQTVLSGNFADILIGHRLGLRLTATRLPLAATLAYNLGAGFTAATEHVAPAGAALLTVNSLLTAALAWIPFAGERRMWKQGRRAPKPAILHPAPAPA